MYSLEEKVIPNSVSMPGARKEGGSLQSPDSVNCANCLAIVHSIIPFDSYTLPLTDGRL